MSVIILCPNGRRVTIKLSPNTPLLYALEQTCTKQGFDSSKYILKQGRNKIDLSSPFRFSGLTNNAKLELVEKDETIKGEKESQGVQLILQTIDGQRLQGTFPSQTTLWDILVTHSQQGPFITVLYMRLQVQGEENLKKTTLRDLGILSGRAIIRITPATPCEETLPLLEKIEEKKDSNESKLLIQKTSQREEEEKEELIQKTSHNESTQQSLETFKESEGDREGCHNVAFPVLPFSMFPENNQQLETQDEAHGRSLEEPPPSMREGEGEGEREGEGEGEREGEGESQFISTQFEPMEIDFQQMLHEARMEAKLQVNEQETVPAKRTYQEPCFRNPVIYHLDSIEATPTTELSEEFFRVTVNDVIMMQEDLKRQVKSLTDAPLETRSMREEVTANKQPGYLQTVIRVILPDRWVLQGTFNSGESIKALVSFVREHLTDSKIKFHLYTAPPKSILKSSRPSFSEAGFVPAANIYMGLEPSVSGLSILSEESIKLYHNTAMEAEIIAHKNRSSVTGSRVTSGCGHLKASQSEGRGLKEEASGSGQKEESGPKLPKWLKLGHK